MAASVPTPKKPPLFTPLGLVLMAVFSVALLAAAISTRTWVKRIDLPPPGTFVVVSGDEAPLFIKLAQKSVKGLHRTEGLRGQLEVPGENAPRPILVRDRSSSEWERKIKIPQLAPGADPKSIESNVVVLLGASIPDDPKLYGQTIPASFDLDMVVPRLDPRDPTVGRAVPDRVAWTVQLLIQPPGFQRVYQRVNRIALIVAAATVGLALVRQGFRRLRAKRKAA